MKILAINTTCDVCSVALKDNENSIIHENTTTRAQISEVLSLLDLVLSSSGYHLTDLDALAIAIGPASFTSLRISAGIVQSLAYCAQLPVALVSSLAMMAQSAYRQFQVAQACVALDAKMNELYIGYYQLSAEGYMQAVIEDSLCPISELQLNNQNQWVGIGDAWGLFEKELTPKGATITIYPQLKPSAQDLFPLAVLDVINKRTVNAEEVLPNYLRGKTAWKKS